MKSAFKKLALCLGLLAASLLPNNAPAKEFPHVQFHHLTGIIGHLDKIYRDFDIDLFVSLDDGQIVANSADPVANDPGTQQVHISKDLTFVVFLKPGKYRLGGFAVPRVRPGQPRPNFILDIPEIEVTVLKDRLTVRAT